MKHIDPYEVERRAVLALTLEPIAEKKGCTTRSRDTKSENLLEFYQENIRVGKSMKFETHVIWSKQFVQGLPVVRLMY